MVSVTVPGGDTAAAVEGLCVSTAYTATVAAINAAGQGPDSFASDPAAPSPASVPDAPVITGVRARHLKLIVEWSPPALDGGKHLTGYTLIATEGGNTVQVSPGPNDIQATITGLVDGTTYALTLVATNRVGASTPALGSGIPVGTYKAGPPESLTATPGSEGDINVSWSPPVDDGGSAVKAYLIIYQHVVPTHHGHRWDPAPGASAVKVRVDGSMTAYTITGLDPANAFWMVKVAAVTSKGKATIASTSTPVGATTGLQSDAVALDPATLEALVSYTGGILVWADPPPAQAASLSVGQVLVGGPSTLTPNGLLRRVAGVSDDGQSLTVTTNPANLGEAFSNLSLANAANPSTAVRGVMSRGIVHRRCRAPPHIHSLRPGLAGTARRKVSSPNCAPSGHGSRGP